jgi:hypothetical protein
MNAVRVYVLTEAGEMHHYGHHADGIYDSLADAVTAAHFAMQEEDVCRVEIVKQAEGAQS